MGEWMGVGYLGGEGLGGKDRGGRGCGSWDVSDEVGFG